MSQLVTRINTTAAVFPLRPVSQGRTVMVPQVDTYYETGTGSPSLSQDNSRGIPTILFAQDVVPTAAGYKSVGYRQTHSIPPGVPATDIPRFTFQVSQTLPLTDSQVTRILITYQPATGNAGVYQLTDSAWLGIASIANVPLDKPISVATVNGVTFICFPQNVGAPGIAYYWQYGSLTPVTLTGLANFQGILAASGYMISWFKTSIAWSSVVDPTDFTPSLITGAGGGAVQEAEADIKFCVAVQNGFLIITEGRTIAATYSGNPRYPFNFKTLEGAGGIQFLDSPPHYQISQCADANFVYAYNTSGLQQMGLARAQDVFPEVTDFLSGNIFDTFDTSTYAFGIIKRLDANQRGPKKITLAGNRYLVISYSVQGRVQPTSAAPPYFNTPIFDTAIIIDTALDRYGKISFDHIDCFNLNFDGFGSPGILTVEAPLGLLRLVGTDGAVYAVTLNPEDPELIAPMKGVVVFGKFQLSRQNLFHLQQVDIEEATDQSNLVVIDYPSIDGKNTLTPVTGTDVDITSAQRTTLFREPGINHSVGFVGVFDLNSVVLTFYNAGRR